LLKACLVNKHREHHPDELMGGGQNRHLMAQPFALSFIEVSSEEIVGEDNALRHQPDDPSQVSIFSLAYLA
jgi:hypothetical protein